MTEDERSEAAIQFHQDFALRKHAELHSANSGQSLEICAECGGEIPEDRRLAVPGVTLCIECKRLEEKQEHEHATQRIFG